MFSLNVQRFLKEKKKEIERERRNTGKKGNRRVFIVNRRALNVPTKRGCVIQQIILEISNCG